MFLSFSRHFGQALWRLKAVFLGLFTLIAAGAVLIVETEQIPFDDAIYFALITGLTVGYGDIVATTPGGRVVSVGLGMIGILFTGLIVAVAVHALQQAMDDIRNCD